jgi:hypothetical protein
MRRPWELDRRTFLRGAAGALLGLPCLEAMHPSLQRAQAASGPPKRLLFMVFNTGTPEFTNGEGILNCFRPTTTGSGYQLTQILQPLAALQQEVTIISGLHNNIGRYEQDPDDQDHPGMGHSILTGQRVLSPTNADPYPGSDISVDQVAANVLGQGTPALPSIFMQALFSAYGENQDRICWKGPDLPLDPIIDSGVAFDQVFSGAAVSNPAQQRALAYKQSVLHHAKADIDRLMPKLGAADKQTLDQYLTGVQSLEQRISATAMNPCVPGAPPQDYQPQGAQAGFIPQRTTQMIDLLVKAFTCDMTRVGVLMLGASPELQYSWLDLAAPYSWHGDITHGGQQPEPERTNRMQAYAQVATWEVAQFADLVQKLKSTPEGDGSGASLLDNTLLLCTSEMSYGNGHWGTNLPVIVAGRSGGAIPLGQHLAVPEQPIANLYVTMLNAVGVSTSTLGNSTGALMLS